VDLDQLLDMSYEQLMTLVHARARRRFSRGETHVCAFKRIRDVLWYCHTVQPSVSPSLVSKTLCMQKGMENWTISFLLAVANLKQPQAFDCEPMTTDHRLPEVLYNNFCETV